MIAIIHPNTLAAIGLSGILERIMPMAQTQVYGSVEAMQEDATADFFHYFVGAELLLRHAQFFIERMRRTIVLAQGSEAMHVPRGFMILDVSLPEEHLTHALVRLAERAHGKHQTHPQVAEGAVSSSAMPQLLTQREIEVLRLLTQGLINKEIADRLCVSLPTVVTHRKNITDKLKTRSVSALTVYALTHGIIKLEEI
jgi:DNA-binding CsgD family transcriptional regulator